MTTFLFDENLPKKIVLSIAALEEFSVEHILTHKPAGTTDEEIFIFAAQKGWILVTQDKAIRKRPHQRQALINAGIGCFAFTGRAQRTVLELVKFMADRLPDMIHMAERTAPPYIIGVPDRGKLERLE